MYKRQGVYDVNARIDDMNVNGIAASLNFGTAVGFDGGRFHKASDKAKALVHMRAYNDWHIDEDVYKRQIQNQSAIFQEYIDWRAENPADDIMTELLTAEFQDVDGQRRRLTRDEVLGYVNLLAAAGNETTTRLIGWAGKVLSEHPDQRRELAKNPGLIPNAIEELLRYESPSPVQARYVTEDVEHHGRQVKAGSIMLLLTASANRDERQFPDSDRFDIHRQIDRHVAFGYGIHFCLGAALARLEARVALEEVLKRFTDWEVDWKHAVQAHTSTVRGWEKLPVMTR